MARRETVVSRVHTNRLENFRVFGQAVLLEAGLREFPAPFVAGAFIKLPAPARILPGRRADEHARRAQRRGGVPQKFPVERHARRIRQTAARMRDMGTGPIHPAARQSAAFCRKPLQCAGVAADGNPPPTFYAAGLRRWGRTGFLIFRARRGCFRFWRAFWKGPGRPETLGQAPPPGK